MLAIPGASKREQLHALRFGDVLKAADECGRDINVSEVELANSFCAIAIHTYDRHNGIV